METIETYLKTNTDTFFRRFILYFFLVFLLGGWLIQSRLSQNSENVASKIISMKILPYLESGDMVSLKFDIQEIIDKTMLVGVDIFDENDSSPIIKIGDGYLENKHRVELQSSKLNSSFYLDFSFRRDFFNVEIISFFIIITILFIMTRSSIEKKLDAFFLSVHNDLEHLNYESLNRINEKRVLGNEFNFEDFYIVFRSYYKKSRIVNIQKEEIERLERIQIREDVIKQVNHDIKSPLMIMSEICENSEVAKDSEYMKLLKLSVLRIEGILKELDKNYQSSLDMFNPLVVIKEVVSKNKILYKDSINILIEESNDINYFIKGSELLFYRVIQNLLNNSIEASAKSVDKPLVKFIIQKEEKILKINVLDNGPGIPLEILNIIGSKGFSYDKSSGKGLGLYNAKEVICSFGGSLEIRNEDKRGWGAFISIYLPIQL